MYDGLLVIDADSHKMENPVIFFDYLEAPYRDRLLSRTDRFMSTVGSTLRSRTGARFWFPGIKTGPCKRP